MIARIHIPLTAIASLLAGGLSQQQPIAPAAPQSDLPGFDTLRQRILVPMLNCPMPVFRPPAQNTSPIPFPRPDSPLLDSLRLTLGPRPTLAQMPIVRSGCVNPLDKPPLPLDKAPPPPAGLQQLPRWRVY
jgi:hypothetical protein